LGVSAFFFSIDPTGCITTSTAVLASEQVTRTNGTRETSEVMFIDVSQNNICTDTALISASGQAPLPEGAFDVQGNLGSATLDSTITMVNNITDQPIELEVHLVWTGTSTILSQSGHYKFSFESCHLQTISDEDFRFATATGTVTDGTMNFTPSPSTSADISNSKEANFSHGCD
jgi:hypothetical protein